MGELGLLVCHEMAWEGSPPSHHHLWQLGDLAYGVMRTGELALLLTGCSTWESGTCTLPGQHSKAGAGGGGMGELAPKGEGPGVVYCEMAWSWESGLLLSPFTTVVATFAVVGRAGP